MDDNRFHRERAKDRLAEESHHQALQEDRQTPVYGGVTALCSEPRVEETGALSNSEMELNIETTRLSLPLEIVLEILDYIDDKDLVYMLTICKSCHRALKERL